MLLFAIVLSTGLCSAGGSQADTKTPQAPDFKFAEGQRVYLMPLEIVDGPTNKLQTRGNYIDQIDRELVRAFDQQGRFRRWRNANEADFVFVYVHHVKHPGTGKGLVVKPDDLNRYVIKVNDVRQETNLDGLLSVCLWNSESHGHVGHEAGRAALAIATSGFFEGQSKDISELVKTFYRDVLGVEGGQAPKQK